jgi:hypothetical protein
MRGYALEWSYQWSLNICIGRGRLSDLNMNKLREIPVSVVHVGHFVESLFGLESVESEFGWKFVESEFIPLSVESEFNLEFIDCESLNLFDCRLFGFFTGCCSYVVFDCFGVE